MTFFLYFTWSTTWLNVTFLFPKDALGEIPPVPGIWRLREDSFRKNSAPDGEGESALPLPPPPPPPPGLFSASALRAALMMRLSKFAAELRRLSLAAAMAPTPPGLPWLPPCPGGASWLPVLLLPAGVTSILRIFLRSSSSRGLRKFFFLFGEGVPGRSTEETCCTNRTVRVRTRCGTFGMKSAHKVFPRRNHARELLCIKTLISSRMNERDSERRKIVSLPDEKKI